MPVTFGRSMRSLHADGFLRSMLALGIAALVLGGWGAWFVLARVSRYEVTDLARLEVDREIHVVQAPLAGRIVSSALVLDREVKAGEVLAEIESEEHRLRIQEENARMGALGPQIRALAAEAASQERAQGLERRASEVAVEQARAAVREAETVASAANQELARLERLHGQGLIPERDLERGKGDAENRRATVEKLALSAGHIESEQRRNETDREARLRRLRGEITVLEGQQQTIAKGIDRLRYEVKRRRILAPIDGRLGEVAVLREGGYVEEGAKLGAVVPRGHLRVIAEFLPPAALGRLRPGQRAQLRLHGFPWTQYGSLRTEVSAVGSEVRDGHVRVELALDTTRPTPIPLQHGLPGTVEVEVESISPATLALRAAGRLLASPSGQTPRGDAASQ